MEKKNKVDYMKPSQWKTIAIKDRTKTPGGQPTFLAMERKLRKELKKDRD